MNVLIISDSHGLEEELRPLRNGMKQKLTL